MQKGEQAMHDAMAAEFDTAGWIYRLEQGGKHLALIATDPGGADHKVPIPSSGRSDATSQANFGGQKARKLIASYNANTGQ